MESRLRAFSGPLLFGDQPVASWDSQHLPIWIAVWSFDNSLTFVMRKGFSMNIVSCRPKLMQSKQLLKFTISLSTKSTKDTSFCPWTCSCTAEKCAQSPCRSSLNTSSFLRKEWTAVIMNRYKSVHSGLNALFSLSIRFSFCGERHLFVIRLSFSVIIAVCLSIFSFTCIAVFLFLSAIFSSVTCF